MNIYKVEYEINADELVYSESKDDVFNHIDRLHDYRDIKEVDLLNILENCQWDCVSDVYTLDDLFFEFRDSGVTFRHNEKVVCSNIKIKSNELSEKLKDYLFNQNIYTLFNNKNIFFYKKIQ